MSLTAISFRIRGHPDRSAARRATPTWSLSLHPRQRSRSRARASPSWLDSEANQAYMQKLLGIQTISYDKVNELRHVLYLKDKEHDAGADEEARGSAWLRSSSCVLRPSGRADRRRSALPPGSARRAATFVSCQHRCRVSPSGRWRFASEAGVAMTGAGATFPYGIDPQDSNIRIAPSLPPGSMSWSRRWRSSARASSWRRWKSCLHNYRKTFTINTGRPEPWRLRTLSLSKNLTRPTISERKIV